MVHIEHCPEDITAFLGVSFDPHTKDFVVTIVEQKPSVSLRILSTFQYDPNFLYYVKMLRHVLRSYVTKEKRVYGLVQALPRKVNGLRCLHMGMVLNALTLLGVKYSIFPWGFLDRFMRGSASAKIEQEQRLSRIFKSKPPDLRDVAVRALLLTTEVDCGLN